MYRINNNEISSRRLTTLDFSIILLYLLLISWRGIRTNGNYTTVEDFFLAGRSLSWPLIGLSLYATNISISSIIGLGGSGYETGISVFNYEWTGTFMLIIFAIFIAPYYLRNRLVTMPEFLARRFDDRSRSYFSVISITVNVLIDIAGSLYASSILLKGIFPDIELYVFIVLMAAVTGLYTISGGLRAVVFTDSIQAVLLTVGSGIVAWIAFTEVGSWENVKAAVDPGFLSLIRPADDPFIPWPTLIISLPILGFYFMCSNQHMVQRVLGARSIEDGRKGAIFAGLLKLPLLFILVLPGVFGRILYPELENPNLIFPELMFDFLPPGVLGLILTGFIAALMSSIDSALTAASSIATVDIYQKIKPESSQKHLINAGKLFIIIAVAIGSLWAPVIDRFPTLWEYLQAVLSYLSPPVVTCYLFGLFWKKATAKGAFYSLILGGIFGILLILNNYVFSVFPPVHYLYSATLIFVFSNIVMITISRMSPAEKDHHVPASVMHLSMAGLLKSQRNMPWYKSYKLFGGVVALLTTILVFIFR